MSVRIAVSPLTGSIYMGKVNAGGTAFIGQKRDVTSDVLRAVIEKADFHGGTFEIEGGGHRWIVTVNKATPAPPDAAQAEAQDTGGAV